jgi:hypothetical protein
MQASTFFKGAPFIKMYSQKAKPDIVQDFADE